MTKARVNADNASADIQGVTAGTGLSGGGTSGTVTLNVDTAVIQARVSGVSDTEIGYLDGVTSALQTQLDGKGALNLTTNAQTGTTYTLALTDNGRIVEMSNASAITLTVPTDASVNFPVGSQVNILQTGAGQITVGGAGVTINATPGLKLRAQWSSATLIKRAANTWVLVGDLSA